LTSTFPLFLVTLLNVLFFVPQSIISSFLAVAVVVDDDDVVTVPTSFLMRTPVDAHAQGALTHC